MIGQEVKYSAAEKAARRNRLMNATALAARQPRLARELDRAQVTAEWVFARDGSLSAIEPTGAWWSGSSLPRRTADALLKNMEIKAPVACFLAPTHAGQLRVALDRTAPAQAIIAIVPDVRDVRLMLGCESFPDEIAAGRIWFAWGARWNEELTDLLIANDGLATPGQFIRTPLIDDDVIQEMIHRAQAVFARENTRRADLVKHFIADPQPRPRTEVCAVAPSLFRLWADAGHTLAGIARAAGWHVLDPDDPCTTSAVALARATAGCGTLVTTHAGRADFPAGLPSDVRVVTWATTPRLPQYDARCANDTLLIADDRWRAAAAGWPADRIIPAAWPRAQAPAANGTGLGVIADTVPLAMPTFELSSHRVLWEAVAEELARDPFALTGDVRAYLARRAARASVADETIDRARFTERLIVPAYQHALVRCLISAGIPVKLFGRGWDALDEFAPHHAGEIGDRVALNAAVASCAALVHAWPSTGAHPIDAAGRPVLRRGAFSKQQWLSEARRLAAGETRPSVADNTPVLTSELIRALA